MLILYKHLFTIYFILQQLSVYINASTISAGDRSIYVFPPLQSQYKDQVKDIEKILVDPIHNRTYIAGANKVFSLSLDLKNVYTVIDKTPEGCTNCNNFIKALEFDLEKRLYVCGTNADDPVCWRFKRDTLKEIKNLQMYALKRCPIEKNHKAVTLFYRSSAFTALEGSINKMRAVSTPTAGTTLKDFVESKRNLPMQDESVFVSAHEFNTDYVYFFFHETAQESKMRKVQHSRVARICYNDVGYSVMSKRFITFLKAQLVCKKETDTTDYYYDELQSTYVVKRHTKDGNEESFIYGVFRTTSEYGGSSAVCRYRLKDIDDVMNTSPLFKKQDDGTYVETPFSNERTKITRRKCNDTLQTTDLNSLKESVTDVLLYKDILPYDKQPLFTINARLKSLVVDDFHLKDDQSDEGTHMIFTGSTKGDIYKIMVSSQQNQMGRLVEKLQPFPDNQPIDTLAKYQRFIYAGGKNGVASLTIQRCSSYRVCNDCVKLKDPYCAWSKSKGECFPVKSLSEEDRIQDILTGNDSECPKDPFEISIEGDDSECPKVENDFGCEASISLKDTNHYSYLLTCTVRGSNAPQIIAWTLNNKEIDDSKTYHLMDGKSILQINNVNEASAGKYECVVQSDNAERKKCNVTVDAPNMKTTTTTTTPTTSQPLVTMIETTRPNQPGSNVTQVPDFTSRFPPINPTGAPKDQKDSSSYKIPFIILIIVCVILILFIALLLLCVRQLRFQQKNSAVDGGLNNGDATSNGHSRGLLNFKKNYKMNRKDSANKELIKQKNKDRVYKPTTIEMNEPLNGEAEPV